jgi:CHAT domain-containing protein
MRRRTVVWLVMAVIAAAAFPAHVWLTQRDELARAVALVGQAVELRYDGRYAEALPLAVESLAIREKVHGPDHLDVASSLNELALVYNYQGRYAEAERLHKRSLAIWEKAGRADQTDIATGLLNLASVYRAQGRDNEAEPLIQRSLTMWENALGPDHPGVATTLGHLAGMYQAQGRYAEAEPLYRRSLAIMEKALGARYPQLIARGLDDLASLYHDQGRYAEAEPLAKRSLEIYEGSLGADHPQTAGSLKTLAELYRAQGRYAEAEPLFERSLEIHEESVGADHPDLATSLDRLARLYKDQDRIADAVAASSRAVGILARRFGETPEGRTVGSDTEQRTYRGVFMHHIALVDAGADAAAQAEAFSVAQLASASSTGRTVAGMAARFAAGSDALAAVVRERQDLADRWQRLDAALVKAASQPPDARDRAAEAGSRARLEETGRLLDALDARIAKEFPQYAELSHPKPLDLAATQALLGPDEAMLVYLVDDDATWLWALRRDDAGVLKIEIGAKALAAEVTALRAQLDPEQNPTLKPFAATRAHELYERILEPAAPLLRGARHVFVVPDGALESLPIGVLVTQRPGKEPDTPADHRAIAWFAREHAVAVLPSVGSLRALRQFASGTAAAAPFAGIGNPVLEGTPGAARGVKLGSLFRGASADVDAVRRLTPLPETADELRAVAKALGADDDALFLGERASEPVLRRAGLERYRVLSFATHGLMSGDLKGLAEPALVLTPPAQATPENDGLLTASKVATLTLNAEWVVLSACNTAAADGTPDAGGLSGLAKAFFYAGARSLLVSHWSVPSQATVTLITGAFAALKQDRSIGRAEALRRAEMAMFDLSNPPEFSHPMAWAPFVLAGEGGAGR